MAIQELTSVVLPPAEPIHVGDDARWREICTRLGVDFPDDYRDFCRTYGSGRFLSGEISFMNLFHPVVIERFPQQQQRTHSLHTSDNMPYPAWPQLPGVIAIGGDNRDNDIFYLVRSPDEPWAVVTVKADKKTWKRTDVEVHEMPLTTFLAKVFGRTMECNIWNAKTFKRRGTVNFAPSDPFPK